MFGSWTNKDGRRSIKCIIGELVCHSEDKNPRRSVGVGGGAGGGDGGAGGGAGGGGAGGGGNEEATVQSASILLDQAPINCKNGLLSKNANARMGDKLGRCCWDVVVGFSNVSKSYEERSLCNLSKS